MHVCPLVCTVHNLDSGRTRLELGHSSPFVVRTVRFGRVRVMWSDIEKLERILSLE